MTDYAPDSHVFVFPFSRQPDGNEVVVGSEKTFISLPPSAVDLLDWLAAGKTVAEAQALYFEKNQEQPDMVDFLGSLEQIGFVRARPPDGAPPLPPPSSPGRPVRYHFAGFPRSVARALTSWPALASYAAVIAVAIAALVREPALFPSRDALLFTRNMTPVALGLLLYSFVMLFLHEMAHLIAARAAGVPSRLGWGNRMWILVAETDVSQLWTVPRSKRYMTLIAGPLYDLTSASIFMCASYAAARQWIVLSPLATQLCHALVVMHLLNLLWQFNFYLRTDFYFVLANFFGCKNLMGDTEAYLRNWVARRFGRGTAAEISHIPARELRVVRGYTLIWVLGRLNMFWILATITVPVMWAYMLHIASILGEGLSPHPLAFFDALVFGVVTLTVEIAGLAMWLRSFLKTKGAHHEVAS